MIPNAAPRTLHAAGVMAEGSFGISGADQAHILSILRDQLYSNKVLAVLREYGSNAWDAHREVGKDLVPIKVVLPTAIEASLTIRDYGPGMTEEEIFRVYTQYGASTKRGSNTSVGMLGIGSKSAFAYSDSFTITSFNGGKKRVYVAVLDETNVGKVMKVHEEDSDETGIEVKVPVNVKDIPDFQREARGLFRFFPPLPDINLPLEVLKPAVDTEHGFVVPTGTLGGWKAVMGCVPYRLNLSMMDRSALQGVEDRLTRSRDGVLRFNIGEVNVSANREELEYTDSTRKAIALKFSALVGAVRETLMKAVDDAPCGWEKRLAVRSLINVVGTLSTQKVVGDLANASVVLWESDSPLHFRLASLEKDKSRVGRLRPSSQRNLVVEQKAKLVLHDGEKPAWGYLHHQAREGFQYVLPTGGATADQALAELEVFLAEATCDGIPILRTSTMQYVPYATLSRSFSPKHHARWFTYTGDGKGSKAWTISEERPEKEDPFVVLERFEAADSAFRHGHVDREIFSDLGEPFPRVFGVKNTTRRPIDPSKVDAVPYHQWIRQAYVRLMLECPALEELVADVNCCGVDFPSAQELDLDWDHPIMRLARRRDEGKVRLNRIPKDNEILRKLKWRLLDLGFGETAWEAEIGVLYKKYPLLAPINGGPRFDVLTEQYASLWLDYIKLADSRR
jgi:hypothetical protein